jgi:thioesterase domain-containing protein
MRLLLSIVGFIMQIVYNNHIGIREDNIVMYLSKPDYLEEHNITISEMIKRRNRVENPDSGYDRHKPEDNSTHEEIARIIEKHEKMKTLRYLENENNSLNERIIIAEHYTRDHNESPLVLNLTKGGLLKDWDFEISL